MTLPIPVLDHVVVNVRDRLDEAAEAYRRLGFHLTPRGHHTLGSVNNLAMLGTDYIELLGVPPGGEGRTDVLDWPRGLNGLVFKTFDADATHAALSGAGVRVLPPQSFSRPVAGGDAAFRTVRLEREAVPAGRLFFCEHATPQLVWQDEERRHANGALGIERAVVASTRPKALLDLFARMFGADAVEGSTLHAGLARIDVTTPGQLIAEYGEASAGADGREDWMAALVVRTRSLRPIGTLLRGLPGLVTREDAVVVPASLAFGTTIEFCV